MRNWAECMNIFMSSLYEVYKVNSYLVDLCDFFISLPKLKRDWLNLSLRIHSKGCLIYLFVNNDQL
jgi:hypothetical protein